MEPNPQATVGEGDLELDVAIGTLFGISKSGHLKRDTWVGMVGSERVWVIAFTTTKIAPTTMDCLCKLVLIEEEGREKAQQLSIRTWVPAS